MFECVRNVPILLKKVFFFIFHSFLLPTRTNWCSSRRVLTTKYTIVDFILFHYGELYVSHPCVNTTQLFTLKCSTYFARDRREVIGRNSFYNTNEITLSKRFHFTRRYDTGSVQFTVRWPTMMDRSKPRRNEWLSWVIGSKRVDGCLIILPWQRVTRWRSHFYSVNVPWTQPVTLKFVKSGATFDEIKT